MYYDLGTVTSTTAVRGADPIGIAVSGSYAHWAYRDRRVRRAFDGHVVRAGVNYHFNWGAAPVVAKY